MSKPSQHLCEVVREILSEYRYIYEPRLHHLVYDAELVSIRRYDERFTDAVFKPLVRGPFSEDIRTALEDEISPPKRLVRRDSGKVYKYEPLPVKSSTELSEDDKEIIDIVMTETNDLSTEDLIKKHISNGFYQSQIIGEPMDFTILLDE